MRKCYKCKKKIKEGEGRFNFPKNVYCLDCAKPITEILDLATQLLKIYSQKTGFKVGIKWF